MPALALADAGTFAFAPSTTSELVERPGCCEGDGGNDAGGGGGGGSAASAGASKGAPRPDPPRCPFAAASAAARSASTSSSSSSSSDAGVHQAWKLTRPVLAADPKLTRRALRALGKAWTLEEVRRHRYADDGWIAVDGRVYDITEHVAHHPGWDHGCGVSTVLSILAHLGSDASEEFADIHRSYPEAWRQLRSFYIGDLAPQGSS